MTSKINWAWPLSGMVTVACQVRRPLGHLTMGGRWQGQLPAHIRPLTAVQAALLLAMMSVVLDYAGMVNIGWPDWAIWPTLAITLLSTVANLGTPSRMERLLWGPATLLMSASLLWVVFL